MSVFTLHLGYFSTENILVYLFIYLCVQDMLTLLLVIWQPRQRLCFQLLLYTRFVWFLCIIEIVYMVLASIIFDPFQVMHVLGFDPHAFAHFRDERKRRRSKVKAAFCVVRVCFSYNGIVYSSYVSQKLVFAGHWTSYRWKTWANSNTCGASTCYHAFTTSLCGISLGTLSI